MKAPSFRMILWLSVWLALMAAVITFSGTDNYAVRLDGRVEKVGAGEFGIPRRDAEFLAGLAGKIIDRIPGSDEGLKSDIRDRISQGYEKDGHRLSERYGFGSEREKLIVYMMLRVNGSLPVYKITSDVPMDISGLLMGKQGNCGVAATRLLMVLDAFGIKGRAVVWYSPSLTGHILVDAYDSIENKAYLLDPTFNIWGKFDRADQGYFDVLARMTVDNKIRHLKANLKAFPFYIVATEGMNQESDDFREEQYLKVKDAILAAFAYEMPTTLEHWNKNYPRSVPYTLDEIALVAENAALQKFNPTHPLSTRTLFVMAGLGERDLKKDYLAIKRILGRGSH